MSAVPSRLRGEQLTLAYGNKTIAESLNVTIPDGHFTAIIGPNGCGKSTLLRTLSRLMTPASGHVWLDGAQIQQYASKEVARRIGLLAQNATTPGDITVQELVARGRYPHQPLFTRWRKEDEEAVNKAMRATGISDLALQSVDTLSGGQRQRAWIAMVLAQETAIMLLDEPTTWLDISHQIDLLELLSELNREKGYTLAAVLHDLNQACRYATHLIALRDGKIVADRLLAGGRPQSAVRLVMNRVRRESFGKNAAVADLDECIDTVGVQLLAVIPESRVLQLAGANGTVPPAADPAVVAGQAMAKRLCGQRVPLTF